MKRFYSVLCDILYKKVGMPYISYEKFSKTKNYIILKKSYKIIVDYSENQFKEELNLTRLQKLYIISIELVIDFLNQLGVPVTVKNVLQNIDKFPTLLDKAYPDYSYNNLLHLII